MQRLTCILVMVTLLVLTFAARAAPPSDPNLWATAFVSGPPVGSPAGSYVSTWTVAPTADWPAGWLLVGLEFQPDGAGLSNLVSLNQPAGWPNTLFNPSPPWLAWYANGVGVQSDLTDQFGLNPAQAAISQWTGGYTTPGAINPFNYHLVFVNSLGGPNPQGRFEIVQSSLTTPTPAPIPEPMTIVLLGSGLAGLAALRRKKAA